MTDTSRWRVALSPKDRAVVASEQLCGEFAPDALLAQLRSLARISARNDVLRARLPWLFGLAMIVAAALLMLVQILPLVLYPAGALLAAAGFGLWSWRVRCERDGISDNLREVALPFLAVLQQDLAPGRAIAVHIDLRSALLGSKLRRATPAHSKGPYFDVEDMIYRDTWFSGRAALADGSTLRWRLDEDVWVTTRSRRTPKGVKTKTRHTKRCRFRIDLSVRNKRYRFKRLPAPQLGTVRLQEGPKRSTFTLLRKLKRQSGDPIDPRWLVDTVAMAYGRLSAPERGLRASD